jgi:hypothetical protein
MRLPGCHTAMMRDRYVECNNLQVQFEGVEQRSCTYARVTATGNYTKTRLFPIGHDSTAITGSPLNIENVR